MNKILTKLVAVTLLGMVIHKDAIAGVCNSGTLAGAYHYQFYNRVGTMTFNGKGAYSLSGLVNNGSGNVGVTGTGTYTVSVGCIATLRASTGGTPLTIYLDNIDNIPAIRLAYHGTFMQGTLTRVFGKI
jgi:hypothetical protein